MQTDPVTQSTLTRQERLLVWLRREGKSMAEIGRSINVARASARRLLNAETAPTYRVAQLRELGIPEGLLPQALDIKPGPKPGASI